MTTLDTPIVAPSQRIEELGRIIMAYSEVTEKLQDSQEQLKGQVQSLRDELSEKNRQLERKTRLAALGEMAAGIAHEIRNPLGGIQLYASLLSKDVSDRPASLQIVDKISAGVKRLESLVSQVLHFTREIRVQRVEMDLATVIEQALDAAQPKAERKSVRIEITGPSELNVNADPLLIGQCLLNLLLNAVEAIDGPGLVQLCYGLPPRGSEAQQFFMSVIDSGPGIPVTIIDRIFNPFFTTKDTGTGLGLAIVHRVVEAHDGTINAANMDSGGAKFEIRI